VFSYHKHKYSIGLQCNAAFYSVNHKQLIHTCGRMEDALQSGRESAKLKQCNAKKLTSLQAN